MVNPYTTKNIKSLLTDKAFRRFKVFRKKGSTIKQAYSKVVTRNIGPKGKIK